VNFGLFKRSIPALRLRRAKVVFSVVSRPKVSPLSEFFGRFAIYKILKEVFFTDLQNIENPAI
jgi:hypothetical protein